MKIENKYDECDRCRKVFHQGGTPLSIEYIGGYGTTHDPFDPDIRFSWYSRLYRFINTIGGRHITAYLCPKCSELLTKFMKR